MFKKLLNVARAEATEETKILVSLEGLILIEIIGNVTSIVF